MNIEKVNVFEKLSQMNKYWNPKKMKSKSV